MIDRKDIGSWLEGPRRQVAEGTYPGERYGLPEHGAGSVAGFGPRLAALFVDWGLAMVISMGVFDVQWGQGGSKSFITLGVFGVMHFVLMWTLGSTIGMRLFGIRGVGLNGQRISFVQAAIRTILLSMFFPAVFWDRDGRGLHDRAPNTILLRTR